MTRAPWDAPPWGAASPAAARRPGGPATVARGLVAALLVAVLVGAPSPRAGGRGRYGGTLQVALVVPPGQAAGAPLDAPLEVLQASLVAPPLCHLVEASRPGPRTVRLEAAPGVDAAAVAARLARVREAPGPARGLLANVRGWSLVGGAVVLELSGPAPALEKSLCHPAFGLAPGPFRDTGARLEAVEAQPAGRPWLDAVSLRRADARTAERLLAQGRVHVVLGPGPSEAPQRFATALRLGPGLDARFRAAVEATVDRATLARFFVAAPAAPLASLLPPDLGGPTVAPQAPARPVAPAAPRDVTVVFDESAPHARAIAERLQVKLQPLGFRLALRPSPREATLSTAPAEGEVVVLEALLPPTAAGALQLWCEAAGRGERLPALLEQLGAADDVEARARDLAPGLLAELPLVPLVTRGLGVRAAAPLQPLSHDELGLPRLADVFLSPE